MTLVSWLFPTVLQYGRAGSCSMACKSIPPKFCRTGSEFLTHPGVLDGVVLFFLYLSLYCILGLQFRLPAFLNAGLYPLLFVGLSFLLAGIWLTKFPFRLILRNKTYQAIMAISLFLGFLLLMLAACAIFLVMFCAMRHLSKILLLSRCFFVTRC